MFQLSTIVCLIQLHLGWLGHVFKWVGTTGTNIILGHCLTDSFPNPKLLRKTGWWKTREAADFQATSPYLEDPQPLGPHCGVKVWRVSSAAAHWGQFRHALKHSRGCRFLLPIWSMQVRLAGRKEPQELPPWPYFHVILRASPLAVDTLSPELSPSPIDSLDGHPSICNCGCSVAAFLVHVHSDLGIGMLIPNYRWLMLMVIEYPFTHPLGSLFHPTKIMGWNHPDWIPVSSFP